ncbi:MAG: HupE/UreJ family protein [Bacteroidota bacterium]
MPYSVLKLNIQRSGLAAELELPVSELELALNMSLLTKGNTLKTEEREFLQNYLFSHIRPESHGKKWEVQINELRIANTEQTETGPYREIIAQIWMQAPLGESPRNFNLYYDAIIHQVVTHKTLVTVHRDWENGIMGHNDSDVGIIGMNVTDNSIPPLKINLSAGSTWTGFKSMVSLGAYHISEGTDHLLFLLALLLTAPVLPAKGPKHIKDRLEKASLRYSCISLLKIVSAFTLGHSLTLVLGATGLLVLPSRPVEMLIAISVLVTAAHAARPLFYGREMYVACGFGLVHGLAFAGVLENLQLNCNRMAISILGFNLGIELMQLVIIIMIAPWLYLLSRLPVYKWFRRIGAGIIAIAAISWLAERIQEAPNAVTILLQHATGHGRLFIPALMLFSILCYYLRGGKIGRAKA